MRQQKGVDAMAEGAIRWLFLQLEGGEGVRQDQFDVEPRRGWRRLDEIAVMDGGPGTENGEKETEGDEEGAECFEAAGLARRRRNGEGGRSTDLVSKQREREMGEGGPMRRGVRRGGRAGGRRHTEHLQRRGLAGDNHLGATARDRGAGPLTSGGKATTTWGTDTWVGARSGERKEADSGPRAN